MQRASLVVAFLSVAFTSAQAGTQTVTSLSAAPSAAILGQAIALTASVSPPGATGKVTFYDGAAILGSATLSAGVANFSTIAIGYGKRVLTARYGGDSNYAGSLSPPFAEQTTTKPGGALIPGPGTNAVSFGQAPILADLNHDGYLDLVSTGGSGIAENPATVWVLLGNGDGTFQPESSYLPGIGGASVTVADIDMDGNPDLVVAGNGGVTSLIGNGDGTFRAGSNILTGSGPIVVRVADINADGKPDLLVLSLAPEVEILYGNGDGTFQTPVILPLTSTPSDLLVADFNGDGIPDLAVASQDGNSVTVMLGTGGGAFGAPAVYKSYGAFSLCVADLNDDGKPDLVVGNVGYASFDLMLGNGDGTFGQVHTIPNPGGPALDISVYDFDGDGKADVISSSYNAGVSVAPGNGDGTFRAPLLFYTFGTNGFMAVGDLNHDGIPDVVTSGLPVPIQTYLGKLAPVFTMTASPNPANLGQNVTLTVTSSYPDATGTVTFTDDGYNSVPLGTVALSNGVATITMSQPPRGWYYVNATYSGDSKYAATVVPQLYLLVTQAVGITMSASPNPAAPGQLITLTATVSMNVGNAEVAFFDGTTPLNAQTLYSTTATYKTSLAAGVHQLTASFPEYNGLLPTSATVMETVQAVSGGQLLAGTEYETVSTATQVLAGDLNGDGITDFAVLDTGAKLVSVYLGTGQGTFQSPRQNPLAFVPGAMVAGQFGGYGTALAVTDPADNLLAILQYYNNGFYVGDGPIAATIPVGQQPVAIATADFNSDGFADLVVANAGSNNVSVLTTLGAAGWLQQAVNLPAGQYPDAVVAGDFNNDGKADFAVANRDDNTVMVFLGNGDGTFNPPVVTATGSGPVALVAGDLNGDGKTDLVAVDSASNQVTILLGNGDGTFRTSATYAAGTGPTSALLVDLNGDNKLDLAVTSASGLLIFTGNGDGTFSAPVNYPQYAGAGSVAAGAFSGDGRMDLVLTMPAAHSVELLVNGSLTTTTLSVTPLSTAMSGKVTLTANVSPTGAVGSVAFYDGITQVGASPVSNGVGSFSTTLLFPGAHLLLARFVGASGYGSSSSGTVALQVSPVPATGFSGPIRTAFPFNSPVNLIPGDFNKDGNEDFAFWRTGNGLVVILGNGDGTFSLSPSTQQAFGGASPATADFNNDGNTDLAYIEGEPSMALGNGQGGFTEFPQIYNNPPPFPASLAVADFNGDGRMDMVLADPAGTADVQLGNGDGTFQQYHSFPAGANPVLVATGDFNGDGKPDIAVANDIPSSSGPPWSTGALNVLNGNGDGTFGTPKQVSILPQPVSMAVADLNGDGHLDVAVVHAGANLVSILLGKGDGTFAPAVTYALGAAPAQLLIADMNGDGHPDLVVMFTSAAPAFAVLYGAGDGTFAAPVNYSDIFPPAAMAVGDVNGDGRMDVILAEGDTVNVFPGATGSLSILQGSPQSTAAGTDFPIAFAVSAPAGTKVTFTAPNATPANWVAGGTFAGALAVTVTADASGIATAPIFRANASSGSYVVLASASGVAGVLSFYLTNSPHSSGDFNGDGHPDLLWMDAGTRQVTVHYYDGAQGATYIGWNWLNSSGEPSGWQLVGAADFDGNGVPDLVWEYMPTGQVTVNYYGGPGGATLLGWNWLNETGNPGWTVVAVADMNNDGVPDLIWQNNMTNQVTVNYYGGAGGATLTGWNWLNSAGEPAGWHVVAAADFDGNGTPDLVWQYAPTRPVTVNYYGGAGGATYQGWNWLNSAGDAGWTVVGANDFNGDGVPDLVWQNDATAQVTVNYYGGPKGASLIGWNWLAATGYPGWKAVVPR